MQSKQIPEATIIAAMQARGHNNEVNVSNDSNCSNSHKGGYDQQEGFAPSTQVEDLGTDYAPSFATQDDVVNNDADFIPSPVGDAVGVNTCDVDDDMATRRTCRYNRWQADFFDNERAGNLKRGSSRYKVNFSNNLEPGEDFMYFTCAFSIRSRDFFNNLQYEYKQLKFYKDADYLLTQLREQELPWLIKPIAGKLKDHNNHVLVGSIAYLWQEEGKNPMVNVISDGFNEVIEITQPPHKTSHVNHVGWGVWQNPETEGQMQDRMSGKTMLTMPRGNQAVHRQSRIQASSQAKKVRK